LREGNPLEGWYQVVRLASGLWMLAEPGYRGCPVSYLVAGSSRALLVDAGTGIGPLAEVVRSLVRLPVVAVATHVHWDRLGGLWPGLRLYVDRRERERLAEVMPEDPRRLLGGDSLTRALPQGFDPDRWWRQLPALDIHEIAEGQVLDLGDRRLAVWETPGHTAGSLSLWEAREGWLFTGDTFHLGCVRCGEEAGGMRALASSWRRLASVRGETTLLLPGRGTAPLSSHILERVERAAQQLEATGTGGDFGDFAVILS